MDCETKFAEAWQVGSDVSCPEWLGEGGALVASRAFNERLVPKGHWIVLYPDGQIAAMSDSLFRKRCGVIE